jgi:hypothetical protein
VAQLLGHEHQRDAGVDEPRGIRMAELVEGHRRDAGASPSRCFRLVRRGARESASCQASIRLRVSLGDVK